MKNTHPISTRPNRLAAFTLVEILVVVAIIIVLVGLLVTYLGSSLKQANNNATRQTMNAIGTALDVYYSTFNTYPPSRNTGTLATTSQYYTTNSTVAAGNPGLSGGQFLTEALIGWMDYPSDGAGTGTAATVLNPQGSEPITGFRVTPNGKGTVYGPYVPTKPQNYNDSTHYFLDANGNNIYYYQAEPLLVNGAPRNSPISKVFDTTAPASAAAALGFFVAADNGLRSDSTVQGVTSTGLTVTLPTTNCSEFLKLLGNTTGTNTLAPGSSIVGSATYLLVAPDASNNYFNKNNIISGKQ